MKRLLFLLIIVFLNSCQQSTNSSESEKPTEDKIVEPVFVDTIKVESEQVKPAKSEIKETITPDDTEGNRILVDRIHLFETGEPYVWVGLKEGFNWRAMDSLKKYADSVIFQDDFETKRTRYPWDKAHEYLDLELLDGITIFNYQHQNFGKSRLKRIEYHEDVLGDQFVGILEPTDQLVGNKFYGINEVDQFVNDLESRTVNDSEIKDSIKKHIGIDSKYQWELSSWMIYPYNLTYTFYSFVSNEEKEKSFLIETNSKLENRVMSEITNDYSIMELTPVPIQLNKRPLLLLWVGPPETDIEWFTPAVFNGVYYEITNNRILELNQFLKISRTDNDSIQCSSEVLLATQQNIDDLDIIAIHNFLRTFDKECRNNAEYSEWSNELLFELLDKNIEALVNELSKPDLNSAMIIDELESPITDKYLPSGLILKVEELRASPMRDAILSSLRTADGKY